MNTQALPRIPILELDAELGSAVHPDQRQIAKRYATAPLMTLDSGPWVPEPMQGALGLLVIEGLLLRTITLAGRSTTELLGEGDLLRPWDHDGGSAEMPVQWRWTVVEPARLAVLDRRFAAVVARWPSLVDALVSRALRRSRGLAFQLTLGQVKKVESRLLLLMWQLAERWGRVSTEGITVPVALTHETLAMLVGAQRPTVTTALGRLSRKAELERTDDGWLLRGEPSMSDT